MNMPQYGHIIYTRCNCGTELNGTVRNKPGFGIHTLTSNIPKQEMDEGLINGVLNLSRLPARDYDNVVYTYFVPGNGFPLLGKFRNRNTQELAAASDARVDARDAFIAEWLTGPFVRYPFEYMGTPFFQADQKPVKDYYQEDPTPLGAPLDAEQVPLGPTTREEVMAFARDGREDAVRAAAAMLMEQFDLPHAQRKYLAIRDTEENVRKWIAAILYTFPVAAAGEVSFDTRLMYINEPNVKTTYYIIKSTGQYVRTRNIQDPNQEKRFYAMIAGADPGEPTCSQTAKPLPNASFMVIDGATRQARFAAGSLAGRAYLRAAVCQDELISNFCSHMNEMQNVHLGSGLCDLYDALQVLEDNSAWRYQTLLDALKKMEPHFTANTMLMLFLMDHLCVKGEYVSRFAAEDEKNGMALFALLGKMAANFGMTEISATLDRLANQRFHQLIENPSQIAAFKNFAANLKKQSPALFDAIAKEMVVDHKLQDIASALPTASNEYLLEVVQLVHQAADRKPALWSQILQQEEYAPFARNLMQKCLRESQLTGSVLSIFAGNTSLVETFILKGREAAPAENHFSWYVMLLKGGVPVAQLCSLMHRTGAASEEMEKLLCEAMSRTGYTEEVKKLFNQYLANVPGAGVYFYKDVLSGITRSSSRNKDALSFLEEISKNVNFTDLKKTALQRLDQDVHLEENREMKEYVEIILANAKGSDARCPNTWLWHYLNHITSARIGRRDEAGLAAPFMEVNSKGFVFPAPVDLLRQPMGDAFLKKLMDHHEEEGTHVIALMSFRFPEKSDADARYVQAYAQALCNETIRSKDTGIASVMYLRNCVAGHMYTGNPKGADCLLPIYDNAALLSRLDLLLNKIHLCLCDMRTDHIADKLLENTAKVYDENVSGNLEKLLQATQAVYKQNHKGGLLGKLFGFGKKND